MGVQNPSARAYAVSTMVSSQSTNREQVGGPAKAGLGQTIGMGRFAQSSVSIRGPAFAGPNYPAALVARRVPGPYPISITNQLGGVGMPRWGMTRAPADGVNAAQRAQAADSVHAFNRFWPARMTRGLVPTSFATLPRNPPGNAPGHGYPFGMNL